MKKINTVELKKGDICKQIDTYNWRTEIICMVLGSSRYNRPKDFSVKILHVIDDTHGYYKKNTYCDLIDHGILTQYYLLSEKDRKKLLAEIL